MPVFRRPGSWRFGVSKSGPSPTMRGRPVADDAEKKAVTDDGETVQNAWVHDMTGLPDVAAQGTSLAEWSRNTIAELRKKPS